MLTARTGLSRDAERLIGHHVDSVGVLDLLLLMRGESGRAWTEDAVCAHLNCPRGWARRELERMCRAGLAIAADQSYRYAPKTARTRAAVDSLARAWRRDRAAVTRMIFARQGAGA